MRDITSRLRVEKSINHSGSIANVGRIPVLKESNYFVTEISLSGDAPKQFINAYFYESRSNVRKRNLHTWSAYIAKTAEKWYPHESIVEYMINQIGITLGINMNAVRLVMANGQIRFLSKYFLKSDEKLIHGAEICGEYLEDRSMAQEIANDRKTAREMFTFEFVESSIKQQFGEHSEMVVRDMVKMLTFDALVGNNDRHFYNWGVITPHKKSKRKPILAPIYDSARGLLWNLNDENLKNFLRIHNEGGKKVVNYINKACPRISIEGNSTVNHFDLILFLKSYDPIFKEIIEELASQQFQDKVLKMIQMKFSHFFSWERNKLISIVINERFKKVRRA